MAKPAETVSGLQPYPAYKPSGVEWLGEVPTHWGVRRMRTVASVLNGATPFSGQQSYWDGDIVWITPHDLGVLKDRYISTSGRKISRAGYESCGATMAPAKSVVISTRAPIGSVGILNTGACTNQGCRLLVPSVSIEPEHLYYCLRLARPELESIGQGTTFLELSRERLASFPLPLPPLSEQAAIVRYLDHADRRMRLWIQAKEQLVKLLEEQRQAIVNEAVTGRVDVRTGQPYSTYKPSGVEWLGEVPKHWQRVRLKTVLRPVDRRSDTGAETLLSLRRDHGIVVYAEHFARPSQSSSLVGFKLVTTGQLVVNRLQANNGLVFCSRLNGLVSPDYSVFEMRRALNMEYLSELLRTSVYRAHFRREATGLGTGTAGFLRLYDDKFLETPVFLPSAREQILIRNFLASHVAKVGRLIDQVQRQIRLVGEFRIRLIADIVTGKLDIREAAARLPDKIGELESLPGSAAQTNIGEESHGEVNGAAREAEV